MDIRHHITAFQAHWMIRYLDPREAPWKQVLDYWLADDYKGRGTLLTPLKPGETKLVKRLPHAATYEHLCINAFLQLDIKQDTSILHGGAIAEPLWANNRFELSIPPRSIYLWSKHIQTYRL